MDNTIHYITEFEKALLSIDRISAHSIIDKAKVQLGAIETIESVIIPVLERIGNAWENGNAALSQYYMSGRICDEIINKHFPVLPGKTISKPGIAIVTLEDYHLLGKQIVHSVLVSSGFELMDYGTMAVNPLIERAINDKVKLLLISVLMLPSALKVKEVRGGFEKAGVDIKIAVGGAPFRIDSQLWQDVGADAFGRTASDAIYIVNRFQPFWNVKV